MREIKFRVWNKKTKEMIEDIHICPQYGWLVMSDNDALSERGKIPEEDLIWMQYTGLKDKNGVEIYEGDIVKVNNINYRVLYSEHRISFVFLKLKEATCYLSLDEIYENYYKENQFALLDIEVIGNIYENKELLKEEGK